MGADLGKPDLVGEALAVDLAGRPRGTARPDRALVAAGHSVGQLAVGQLAAGTCAIHRTEPFEPEAARVAPLPELRRARFRQA